MNAQVIIKNARIRGREGFFSIAVDNGLVVKISRDLLAEADTMVDAKGKLVTESFVVSHLHLDKVRTGMRVTSEAVQLYQSEKMDTKMAIMLASKLKQSYSESEIEKRVRPLLKEAVSYGVTHMRGFVDTDTKAGLKGVKAILKLKEEFKNKLELQVVAFPQEGIESDPGAEEFVRKAMELGADVVGGIPWLEASTEQQEKHIAKIFSIAKEFDRPIAMLVDDEGDPRLRTLEMLARRTISDDWIGRVEACHARAMYNYPEDYLKRLIKILKRAEVGVVSNPHTGPLHARVSDLLKAGIIVALGQDDCYDAYYPYGRCKMLEVAFLSSHILRMMTEADMELLYDMVTINAAKVIGKDNFVLKVGSPANLVVLNARSVHEALMYQCDPSIVFKDGKIVFEESSDNVSNHDMR